MASAIASFHVKVRKIKAAIGIKLNAVQPDPLQEDRQFSEAPLYNLTEVTDDEILKLLSSMQGKSLSWDYLNHSFEKIAVVHISGSKLDWPT